MTRKKKIETPISGDNAVKVVETELVPVEPIIEETLVKVRVKVGTLSFEQGTFQKDNIITITKERLAQFDPHDVEVIA